MRDNGIQSSLRPKSIGVLSSKPNWLQDGGIFVFIEGRTKRIESLFSMFLILLEDLLYLIRYSPHANDFFFLTKNQN